MFKNSAFQLQRNEGLKNAKDRATILAWVKTNENELLINYYNQQTSY